MKITEADKKYLAFNTMTFSGQEIKDAGKNIALLSIETANGDFIKDIVISFLSRFMVELVNSKK